MNDKFHAESDAPLHDPDDAALLDRLDALRTASDRSGAPAQLWEMIRRSGSLPDPRMLPRDRSARRLRTVASQTIAAVLLLGAGFYAGRAAAPPEQVAAGAAAHGAAINASPMFAVQRNGSALVSALDALGAAAPRASEADRAEGREVALAALTSVIATAAADYPQEMHALIGSLSLPSTPNRGSETPNAMRLRSER